MRILPALEVKNHFGAVANIVKSGEPVTITQYGTPTMMILPYEIGEAAWREHAARTMIEFMQNMAPVNPDAPELSLEDINKLVHELR